MLEQTPLRFARLPEVLDRIGFKRDALYRMIREGSFPKPYRIGRRASGWREDEIVTWIQSRAKD